MRNLFDEPKELPDEGVRPGPKGEPGWHPDDSGLPSYVSPEPEGEIMPDENPGPPTEGEVEPSGNVTTIPPDAYYELEF